MTARCRPRRPRARFVCLLALALLAAAPGCKKNKDALSPMTSDELKAKAPPAPPESAKQPVTPPPAPTGPKTWVNVPDLGVKVETPAGWAVTVPIPGHYTVKGNGQDGFVQVNKAAAMPASPDAAAAQRCLGAAKTIAKEKTPAGAIFVMCETEISGNKSRSINAWLHKAGAPAAAHCTITTDRNLALLEGVCRSLSAM